MFILKLQDVEISTIQHPKRDQQVPVLHYQGQSFRLISIFKASQEEEAKALWRELTDHRGKACVLLEEPERYSVWGKIRLDQVNSDTGNYDQIHILIRASILLLQVVYIDITDFLGHRQAELFKKDLVTSLQFWHIPEAATPKAVEHLLTFNPLQAAQLPVWEENHVVTILQELHRLGKAYFGNSEFANSVVNKLQDIPDGERSLFISWLNQSPVSKLWH